MGLTIPPDYKPLTKEQWDYLEKHWDDTFDRPFGNPLELYSNIILKSPTRKDIDLTFKESVSEISQYMADSTGANKDSLNLFLSSIFYESHKKIDEKIEPTTKNNDEILGAMLSMEDAKKMLEANRIQKGEQFKRIKSVYNMGNDATYDTAYERLLEDLTADELAEIQKTGEFKSKDPYGAVPNPGISNILTTGKEDKEKITDFRNMLMPTPLYDQKDPGRIVGTTGLSSVLPSPSDYTKEPIFKHYETDSHIPLFKMLFGEGTVEMPFPSLWGYGNPNVKMDEDRFKGYLAWEKLKEIETEYKNSTEYDYARGKGVDWDRAIEASNKFAESNYKKEYKDYVSYQKEVLKDISSPALDKAISRLESDIKVEELLKGTKPSTTVVPSDTVETIEAPPDSAEFEAELRKEWDLLPFDQKAEYGGKNYSFANYMNAMQWHTPATKQ